MGAMFGGNKGAKEAAEKARREQRIASERQMSELKAQEQRDTTTRRNPRGRRLFSETASTLA